MMCLPQPIRKGTLLLFRLLALTTHQRCSCLPITYKNRVPTVWGPGFVWFGFLYPQKRYRIIATWARVVEPLGSNLPLPTPFIRPSDSTKSIAS